MNDLIPRCDICDEITTDPVDDDGVTFCRPCRHNFNDRQETNS